MQGRGEKQSLPTACDTRVHTGAKGKGSSGFTAICDYPFKKCKLNGDSYFLTFFL